MASLFAAFTDRYALWWVVEIPLFLFVLYAVFETKLRAFLQDKCIALIRKFRASSGAAVHASATAKVKRGRESWEHLGAAYGGLVAVFFSIPLFVEAAKPYRVVLSILNLLAVLYLCFFNGWSKNTIIRLMIRTRDRFD